MSGSPRTAPNVDNYMIGKGVLEIAKFGQAYAKVGNCPKFEFEMTEQALEHFSSQSGLKEQDAETVIQSGYTVNFTLDEIAVENLRMFLKGTLSGTRIIYANQNMQQYYSLRFTSDNPVGPNMKMEFWKCKLTPNGAFSLISDEYTSMSFTGKGLADKAGHSTSPFLTATFDTTTSSTSSTISTTSTVG